MISISYESVLINISKKNERITSKNNNEKT